LVTSSYGEWKSTAIDYRNGTEPTVGIVERPIEGPISNNFTLGPTGRWEWWYSRTVRYPIITKLGNATTRKLCYYMNHLVDMYSPQSAIESTITPNATSALERYDPSKPGWVEAECNTFFKYLNTQSGDRFYGTLGITVVAVLLAKYAYRLSVTTTRPVMSVTNVITSAPYTATGVIVYSDGLVY
jgi:hypothetical protein